MTRIVDLCRGGVRLTTLLAIVASVFSFFVAVGPAAATPATDCYSFVQGNIPWNYEGTADWADSNVQNLCAGTTRSAEPGLCFDRVMQGGINWGGGTQWQWENALNLCKGTSNANATIQCFQGQIGAGAAWQDAIPACNGSGGGSGSGGADVATACFNFIQGNIPWNYEGTANWADSNVQDLCAGTNRAPEPGRCFDRVMQGNINWGGGTQWQWENALNLCKGTNNANATVSCFQGKIAGGIAWAQAIQQCNP